jgi:hypothetical protein
MKSKDKPALLDAIRNAITNKARIDIYLAAEQTAKGDTPTAAAPKDSDNTSSNNAPSAAAQWTMNARVRLLSIILLDAENRSLLKSTGAKATRADLDKKDTKKINTVWTRFAKQQNSSETVIAPCESS